jgi:hypothetical protein
MNNVRELLTSALNPQVRLMQETRNLRDKWDKTGLLEGLENDTEKSNMAILLENQAKQLIEEATSTGTSANSEQWAGVALPLVRRVFAEFAAKEFVSVQPMNLPSGLVFYLDFKYGTTQGAIGKDGTNSVYSSLFGGTGAKSGSTDKAVGGLYGAGRFAYTINDKTIAVNYASASVSATTLEDLNWNINWNVDAAAYGSGSVISSSLSASVVAGRLFKLTTTNFLAASALSGSVFDASAVRSFVPVTASVLGGASGILRYFPALTKLTTTNEVQFIVEAEPTAWAWLGAPGTNGLTVHYSVQPKDSNRGDFEDATNANDTGKVNLPGASTSDTGLNKDIGIPEVNLELKSEPIVAKTRKLKAVWTPELAQDLNAYHSIDAEAELTALLSEYVSMEIDLEILDMLIVNAPAVTTERWSAKLNREIIPGATNGSYVAVDQTVAGTGGYYEKSTWYRTLGIKCQKVSNKIHQLTLRGGANFMVCSPDVATILESIPGFTVNTDGDQAKFAMGVTRVGTFAQRFQVYKNPYMTDNVILMGFRGNNFLETGAVYAPYVPLVQTPLVYDPVNFTPRRGVMTRYAKKIVRPEFYGKILVADLDTV